MFYRTTPWCFHLNIGLEQITLTSDSVTVVKISMTSSVMQLCYDMQVSQNTLLWSSILCMPLPKRNLCSYCTIEKEPKLCAEKYFWVFLLHYRKIT